MADDDPVTVGTLVAVSVGTPRDVPWRGRTVHTGVWKRPVDGPQMVRTLNIDGDGQGDLGGHGGPHRAVMVYQVASYDHWREHLGRDDLRTDELQPGQFGENFTVDGLADDTVCVGDRYRIGEAVFEVSQPRVTCYRVGLRLNEPRLPALLVSHRRPGFYFRVLQEGVVQAGDPIIRVARSAERMTIADIDALLYLPGHDREQVASALRIPELSPGWQGSFEAILAAGDGATGNVGLTDDAAAPPVAWPGFRPVTVAEVVRESDSVVSLRLASPDKQPLPAALPGQFVALRLRLSADERPTSRSYSLSGAPGAADYRISVKQETHGVVSRFIHTGLRVGSSVELAAPRGRFVLTTGDDPVLLLSAGIGATPVLAMLYALVAARSGREVWWLHGARNSREHPFAAEAAALLTQLPHVRVEICYSAPLSTDVVGRDYQQRGRLTGELLAGLPIPRDARAYICGPVTFMDGIRAALIDLGLPSSQVLTEVFGAGPAITPGIASGPVVPVHQPAGVPGKGPDITFARSGLTVPWRDDVGSLLELAEACDVPSRWSCRTGICHTCETGLLAGTVRYDPPLIDPPADGNVLVCSAQPLEEVVVDL